MSTGTSPASLAITRLLTLALLAFSIHAMGQGGTPPNSYAPVADRESFQSVLKRMRGEKSAIEERHNRGPNQRPHWLCAA